MDNFGFFRLWLDRAVDEVVPDVDADVGGGGGVWRVAARGTSSSELVDFSSSA